MKKLLLALLILTSGLMACQPTTGDTGANEDDDGTKAATSTSAFRKDTLSPNKSATDTSIGEDRVDIQKRDSVK